MAPVVDTILVAEAYTALRGAAMLALAPVGVLVWRRRPPARVLTWIVVGMLLAGQVMAIAVAVVVGQTVARAAASRATAWAPRWTPTWRLSGHI
jgi:disulfide bond formation protein DsbB